MKKITYIFIMLMLVSCFGLSAQNDYKSTLNNGRSQSSEPTAVESKPIKTSQANNNQLENDRDISMGESRSEVEDWFYPTDLEGLKNSLISNNGTVNNLEVEERLDDLAIKIYELAEFNEQLRLENQDIRRSLEACCERGEESNGSFLVQNAPNPFNERTSIDYFISGNINNAFIQIKTVEGNIVKTIKLLDNGYGSIQLSSDELQTGYYVYTLHNNDQIIDSKVLILTK